MSPALRPLVAIHHDVIFWTVREAISTAREALELLVALAFGVYFFICMATGSDLLPQWLSLWR